MRKLICFITLCVFILSSNGAVFADSARSFQGKLSISPSITTLAYGDPAIQFTAEFISAEMLDSAFDQSVAWSISPKNASKYVQITDTGLVSLVADPPQKIKRIKVIAKSVKYNKTAIAKLTLKRGKKYIEDTIHNADGDETTVTVDMLQTKLLALGYTGFTADGLWSESYI